MPKVSQVQHSPLPFMPAHVSPVLLKGLTGSPPRQTDNFDVAKSYRESLGAGTSNAKPADARSGGGVDGSQTKPLGSGAYGKAKDLGPPIAYGITTKFGGVNGLNKTQGYGLQVGVNAKTMLDPNTSLTATVSASGYQGRLQNKNVDGSVLRASVAVNRNLPTGDKTKWNVGVGAGVEVNQRRGSPDTSSVDLSVSAGFNRPLQEGKTKINLIGEATAKLVVGGNTQIRPKVSVGVKVADGPFNVTSTASVETRVNLNGPNQGKVSAVLPVLGIEAAYKASSNVSIFGNLQYTIPTGLQSSSGDFFGTSTNPGWSFGSGIRIEL